LWNKGKTYTKQLKRRDFASTIADNYRLPGSSGFSTLDYFMNIDILLCLKAGDSCRFPQTAAFGSFCC
jgi:hypothetical protein